MAIQECVTQKHVLSYLDNHIFPQADEGDRQVFPKCLIMVLNYDSVSVVLILSCEVKGMDKSNLIPVYGLSVVVVVVVKMSLHFISFLIVMIGRDKS